VVGVSEGRVPHRVADQFADAVPAELYIAVGVSVVWEADATHYVDDLAVTVESR
jgi:hypothetical protein